MVISQFVIISANLLFAPVYLISSTRVGTLFLLTPYASAYYSAWYIMNTHYVFYPFHNSGFNSLGKAKRLLYNSDMTTVPKFISGKHREPYQEE